MSVFDIVVISLLLISAILGFKNGFVKQLFGLLAVFLGVYCAFKFSGLISSLIQKLITVDPLTLSVVAFILIMILVWIGVVFLGKLLNSMVKLAALAFINRLLGLLFATIQTLFIISAMVYAFSYLEVSKEQAVNNELSKSKLYQPMLRTAKAAFPYIKF